MATYKVLQDIEAEDTLIGPLTPRQCIYAAIAVIAGYLSFLAISKHAGFLVFFLLPFIAFGMFFAFPWSKQQPTEVWALAKIRFYLKPRKRIWNQSGVKELVSITVPKAVRRAYASNLTPNEVTSRLKALADTIDSRGWAIKNVDLGYYTRSINSTIHPQMSTDRLVTAASQPQEVPNYDATATSDIFDVENNPVAQKFDAMMTQSAASHRQQIVEQMAQQQNPKPPQAMPATGDNGYWHMRTINPSGMQQPNAGQAGPSSNSSPIQAGQGFDPQTAQALQSISNIPMSAGPILPAPIMPQSAQPYAQTLSQAPMAVDYSSLRAPLAATNSMPGAQPYIAAGNTPVSPQITVTAPPNPAILELANNNDLNVATIAREAQSRNPNPSNEVVISLH